MKRFSCILFSLWAHQKSFFGLLFPNYLLQCYLREEKEDEIMRLITFDLFQASANLWITFISSINIRCHLVAGKGNSMAFLIPCRHWFPHISGERRLNRGWRSRKRQSSSGALQDGPRDPRAHICLDCALISQPLPARPAALKPAQSHQPWAHGWMSA